MLVFYYYLTIMSCLVYARGPHHPRGEAVVKRHVHYRPTKGSGEENLIKNDELLHDTEHIQEHLDDVISEPDLKNLTDEELEFYYFQVHDTDKNSKLDGLEILQALQHTAHKENESADEDDESVSTPSSTDDINYYIELIDRVFDEDDLDNDGYLSYPEYVAGRKRASVNNEQQPAVQIVK